MELLILRHAIAFERDRRRWRDDGERPLTAAGIRQSRKAAAGLKEFSRAPDRLLTSPLVRARQTARILTEIAGWPRAEEVPELAPDVEALSVLSLLAKVRSGRVAIVGHQPGLGRLLAVCLAGAPPAFEMKKNACACVWFAGTPRAGHGVLKWLATPRMLRALRRD